MEQEKGSDFDEVEVISYSSVSRVVDEVLNTTKVPDDLKREAQSISCTVQPIVEEEDVEERPHSWSGLPICYSQRKVEIISHQQNQI